MIHPLTFTADFNISILILLGVTIFMQLLSTINRKSELDGKKGILLIIIYIIYLGSLL